MRQIEGCNVSGRGDLGQYPGQYLGQYPARYHTNGAISRSKGYFFVQAALTWAGSELLWTLIFLFVFL